VLKQKLKLKTNFIARGSSAAENELSTTLDDSTYDDEELDDKKDMGVSELENNPNLLERVSEPFLNYHIKFVYRLQSFISNQNEPEKVPEVSTKRIFPFLKRGQGLVRFRMSNNDLSAQRKRIVSTISKKKSPSLQSTDTKTEVAPRKEQLRPNKCLKANPAKPAIAPELTQPPVPKKVK
jgi:hypothetical protein